jgi:hypothetical protein
MFTTLYFGTFEDLDDRTALPGCMEALRKYICNFETEDSGITSV